MLSLILALLIGFITIFAPGFLIALALLRKTGLNLFEISVIGFIFGWIAPTTLTWLESYLISITSIFSFSIWLFEANALILTAIGAYLCWKEGAFSGPGKLVENKANAVTKQNFWIWVALVALMLMTFFTRMQSVSIAPTFFEFDPYFDLLDAKSILVYGQQMLLDPSAWPTTPGGTNHRIEPLMPYLEAYWYDLANGLGPHFQSFSTTLMSNVSSLYPPITAALLVFIIFAILDKEYDKRIALVGAAITSLMPVLFTTFIAGEQLLEPWGIMALFFFIMAYAMAVKSPKDDRLAVFAGIAFVSNFLGAHYYTVTTGVLVIYILLQGVISAVRGRVNRDFYRMNAILIAIIVLFTIVFVPYEASLNNRTPNVLGIPITASGPILALLLVAAIDYGPGILKSKGLLFKGDIGLKERLYWIGALAIISILLIVLTPIGNPIKKYVELSVHFTTPSSPLFMTVQEYVPTGLLFNFGASGFGLVGASIFGLPVLVYLVSILTVLLIAMSIIYRKSETGILYMAIALPLLLAGFSEVKYLPHFGVAYILMLCITMGEIAHLADHNFKLVKHTGNDAHEHMEPIGKENIMKMVLSFGLFFIEPILGVLYLGYYVIEGAFTPKYRTYTYFIIALFVVAIASNYLSTGSLIYGESITLASSIQAWSTASSYTVQQVGSTGYYQFPARLCNQLANQGNSFGYTLYCNVVQDYWLEASAWMQQNVGPYGARVLSWWDYGDWINWFGNTNAVLRGDNANAIEDYEVAAQYVLNPNDGHQEPITSYMDRTETKYVLFDEALIQKWGALDFLACIHANQTSMAFATAQGQLQNPPQPYALGYSNCEIKHDPQYALIPLAVLTSSSSQQSIGDYCSMSNGTAQYASTLLVTGYNITNESVCTSLTPNSKGVLQIYHTNGTKMNAVLQESNYLGVVNVGGQQFVQYMVMYLPNGPNGTITDAPSEFYVSNFYQGFFLGSLKGFTQVFPANATGINFVNGTYPIRIFALNNFTGRLPPVPSKPPWIDNNYSMP